MQSKEDNVLFENALNTFYLRLYGIGHMIKSTQTAGEKPAATTTRATHLD